MKWKVGEVQYEADEITHAVSGGRWQYSCRSLIDAKEIQSVSYLVLF
jgi:hypothetical protein